MSKFAKTLAAAAAFAAFAPAVSAQPYLQPALGRYDAAGARTLGEQLVLCDLASYFGSGPDLDAHRIYVQRRDRRFEPTFPTAITRGGSWYDEDLERAYMRHRRAGRVSAQEVHALRDRYGPEMEDAFRRSSNGEQRFFQGQTRFCRELARQSRR